ncbi:uncharacterized protein yc1106_03549 [Curvularia clavata]|uniref:Uncharacterized protein n=1 Tax=Curvularia clavata TaxID=95742 RepID=A0A9Q8Z5X9_CURCL|nr:uncharacterized protein yc1106_03549 [Curvularia clavata]
MSAITKTLIKLSDMSAPFPPGFHTIPGSATGSVSTSPGFTPPSQGSQFRNYNEVMQALATRPMFYDYHPPDEDCTVPRSQLARDGYIRQLYDSFIDTNSCIDCENTAAFVNRWQGIATHTSQYTPQDIEQNLHTMFHSRFGDLYEVQMSAPNDEEPCIYNDRNPFQSQLETPQWGFVGSEEWGCNSLSTFSGYGQPFEMGAHGSDTYHTQYQALEPRYVWEDSFGHRQEKEVDEWMDVVSPKDWWNYVDVDSVGMYGSDSQGESDTAASRSTHHVYEGSQSQLQEDMLAVPITLFQRHIDYTPGSATANEDLGKQSENTRASERASIPRYTSFREAKDAISPKYWRCPADDPTIPRTDADRQRYIRQLLSAINNVEDTIGVHGHSFKKRWYDPSKGHSRYYTPLVKEALCWLILFQAESLHTDGPSETFTSFDPNFWTAAKRTCRWSFSNRINMIAELLATSKSKCDALLGGGSLQLVVANPGQRLRATKADVKQNEKRKELLETVNGKERLNKKARVEERE